MQCETHTSVYIHIMIYIYIYIYICHIELLHPRENVVSVLAFLRVPAMSGFGVGGWSVGAARKTVPPLLILFYFRPALKPLKQMETHFCVGGFWAQSWGTFFLLCLSLSLCMLHSMCPFSCVFLESFFVGTFVVKHIITDNYTDNIPKYTI